MIEEKALSILVVEDEKEIAEIMKRYLELYHNAKHIILANNGSEAIMKMQNQEFDLVITDVFMPNKDGLQLIDHMKKSFKFKKIKIMVISGTLTSEVTMLCMKKGIRQMLVKPFTAKEFLMKVFATLGVSKDVEAFTESVIRKSLKSLNNSSDLIPEILEES